MKALEHDAGALNAVVKESGAAQTGLYNILTDIHQQLEESTRKNKEIASQEADSFLAMTNAAFHKFNEQMTAKHSVLTEMLADYVDDVKRTSSDQQKRLEKLSLRLNTGIDTEVCVYALE